MNAATSSGWTALHGAAFYGYSQTTTRLLEAGADVNAKDLDGRTPLWWASEAGHKHIVKLLQDHGAKR